MRVWAIILVGLELGFASSVDAGPIEEATAAERRDDCQTAVKLYREQAAHGVAQALSRLGYFSSIGYCAKRDWREAANWYSRAADAGDQEAIASLSHIGRNWRFMNRGQPLPSEIYAEVEKAAKRGSAVAQYSLGLMNYPIGDPGFDATRPTPGIAGNLAEAITWFQRGADQGDFDSLVTLATAYAEGIGVAQDYVEAHKLLNVAAPRVKYADMRNDIIKRRDELATRMTATQIAEAQKLARDWKPVR
ncbi:tetratricopeptide repeat protein [Bradyrhizobium sp. URHA0013]|uniref:tetratricopeptide repeat protein n=1 Tax=Bradyrhizobium sp. URHA0013 TaxID=1380352 RepID=UPI000485A7B6|nr:tetratricopeptide repeat protein [Bradyrhizobium sp. URHA0013]